MNNYKKKGASSLLTLIILAVVIAAVATTATISVTKGWGHVNEVSQKAINLEQNIDVDIKDVNGANSKPLDGEHTHDWRLVKKEVLSPKERKDTYLCFSCGVREERFIEGDFALSTDVKDGVYIINNNTFTNIPEYIKTNYEAGINYTVKFNYTIVSKPSSLPVTALGVKVSLQNIINGTEKDSTEATYFTGTSGSMSHNFYISDTSIVKDYPVLAFKLVSKIKTTATIRISDFQIIVEDPVHSHEMSDWATIQKATCISKGLKMRNCTVEGCAYNESAVIDKLPHSMYEDILSKPTCKEEGEIRNTCLVCGYTSGIQKVFGPHRPVYTIVKESPDCKTSGTYAYICLDCGSIITSGSYTVPHKYVITTQEPSTCTTKGKEIKTCSICGDKKETILDYAHNVEMRRTLPNCVEASYTEFYCTKCGKVTERLFYSDKLAHDYGFVEKKVEDYGYPARPTTMYYYVCSGCNRTYKTNVDCGLGFSSYVEETGTKYTLVHMQENVENDNYTIVKKEVKYGVPNTKAIYSPDTYEGFTAPTEASVLATIKEDGSTVVEYKYKRKRTILRIGGCLDGTNYDSTTSPVWQLCRSKFDLILADFNHILPTRDPLNMFLKYGTRYELKNLSCEQGYKCIDKNKTIKGVIGIEDVSIMPRFETAYNVVLNSSIKTKLPTLNYSKSELPVTLPIPVAEGYTFSHWEDASGNAYTEIPIGSLGTKTYTAKWKKNYVKNNSFATKNDIVACFSEGLSGSMDIVEDVENYNIKALNIKVNEGSGGYYLKATEKLSTNYNGQKAIVSFWAKGTGTWLIGYEQGGTNTYVASNDWEYYSYEFTINTSPYYQFVIYCRDSQARNIYIRNPSITLKNQSI